MDGDVPTDPDNVPPEDDADVDVEVEYGVRRSRRRTNFARRDSSSLYPAQIMDVEVYTAAAELAMTMAQTLLPLLSFIVALDSAKRTALRVWERGARRVAAVGTKLRADTVAVGAALSELRWLLTWIGANGELALLYVADLTYFVRRKRPRIAPERHRRLDEISRADCDTWFQLSPHELRRFFLHLRFPAEMSKNDDHLPYNDRRTYNSERSFILFLHHLRKGLPYTTMATEIFGGDPRHYTNMFELVNHHLYYTFYNKISGTSLSQWLPQHVHRCRRLVHNALSDHSIFEAELVNGRAVNTQWIHQNFDFDTFRIFGFVDGYEMECGRPADVKRSRGILLDLQKAMYSGYKKKHGLKALVVTLPLGIVGGVHITEMRQNDNGLQNISGLCDYLVELLGDTRVGGFFPCLYGDSIFAVLPTIVPRQRSPCPLAGKLVNMRLATLRQICEHVNADHKNHFHLWELPRYLRLFRKGGSVRRLATNSFFLLNCYYCLHGTRCRYFGQAPPTLEDYIPLDEVIDPPPAVILGDIWEMD